MVTAYKYKLVHMVILMAALESRELRVNKEQQEIRVELIIVYV